METIRTWPESTQIVKSLATPFMCSVFHATLSSFEQIDNPLRLNNLATGLRELLRHVLRNLAPDADIKACEWYRPIFNEKNVEVITKSQRIKYAVQAGLEDEFITDTLSIDIGPVIKRFGKLDDGLNKYTHIEEKTFGTPAAVAEVFAREALSTFIDLYSLISDCRAKIRRAVEEQARESINDEIRANVIEELDSLASTYQVDQVNVEDFSVDSINATMIMFSLSGSIDCDLQYGSNSDVERGDGLIIGDNYPFACRYKADVRWPTELELVSRSLEVDNSSFYED